MQSGGAQPAPDIGQSQQAATAAPDSNCTQRSFGGGEYWFCDDHRDWQDAQARCQAVGLDLVRIDTTDENDFVRSHVGSDTWIGGNDRATEGTWVWPIGGDQFWQGDEHGSVVGGLFESWGAGQPNDLGGEDCAQIFPDGNWLDDGCEDREEYVCEQVDDDCPNDPAKAEPGQCGCGVPDTDSDGDGFADCQDECPNDPSKLVPGDCGCADSPAPAGTACNDGLCPANAQCDGAGSCGDPEECAPDTGCTVERFHTVPYWFCRDDKTWVDARAKCQAAGMDLAQIESAEENEFIRSKLHEESFIGATDSDVEGEWRWAFSQQEFWEGDEHTGVPIDDAYNNWNHDEPEDFHADERDCGKITLFSGDWRTDECTTHTEAYVCELVPKLMPVLGCVRRYKSPSSAALFGYRNDTGVTVVVPHGETNELVPEASDVVLPQEFEPGVHEDLFWVPFDVNDSVTWNLADKAATATGSSRLCDPGDVPPQRVPGPAPAVVPLDIPALSFDSVSGQLAPEVTSEAFSHASTEIYGSPRGPEAGNTSNEEAGPADVTFTVDALNFSDSEGLCGTVDPFVNRLVIDGHDFGKTRSGTVQVDRTRRTISVRVDVNDDDAFLCLKDDNLRDYEFQVDLYHGASNECIDNGHMCFTVNPIVSPRICFDWNAQFIDSGPWAGIASEDFLAGKAVQSVPASFARYQLRIEDFSGVLFDRGGVLDEQGCIPDPKLPIREHWQLTPDFQVKAELFSQHCLDPAGTNCAMSGSNFTGANVVIHQSGQAGPAALCGIYAVNPAAVADPGCRVNAINWPDVPPSPLRPSFIDHNSVTRAGAAISHLFRREAETQGGLGIERAMIDRRLEGNGRLEVVVDEFCVISDRCSGRTLQTSCRSGNSLILEPDNPNTASVTRFKYIVAHEFGHYIQGNGQGLMATNYGCGPGDPNQPALCRCDAVPVDQQLHCLQSLEEPGAAQIEGFAQYYAAKAFNEDLETDCTFAYYKPVADTACFPGAASCDQDPATGLFVSNPPIPLSCEDAVRWRNNHCVDASSSPDVLASGTEYDWLEFLYAVGNVATPAERWNMAAVFDAYVASCGSVTAPARCTDKEVSWAGSSTTASLSGGVQAIANANLRTQAAVDRFRDLGDMFGVSNQP